MRTSISPNTASPFAHGLAALAIALTSGLAGAGQAFAASAPSAVSLSVAEESRSAAAVANDWNVDYPSQIGPEGPSPVNVLSRERPTAAGTTQENAGIARRTAER